MSLAAFIRSNTSGIISEWESFARSLIPLSNDMTPLALRNHIKEILEFVVNDMDSPQTSSEQITKSHGKGAQKDEPRPSAAETHAALRLAGGFNLDQMVAEYRALRASVIKLWKAAGKEVPADALQDVTRFNEAIDQALTESIRYYSKKLGDSKNLFLGILTHDLRNPLGAMVGAADLIPKIGAINERQSVLVSQILESGQRIDEILSQLRDITKARFGSGLPVIRAAMDMGFIGRQLVDEARLLHPQRKFALEISGDMEGSWDKARIGQVFSNLLGNAAQYSFKDTPISITMKGGPKEVTLSVHNEGIPISSDKIERIFDALLRVSAEDKEHEVGETANLGLGLYITKEIVTAHGGTLGVVSSEKGGTTFTATFPRSGLSDAAPAS